MLKKERDNRRKGLGACLLLDGKERAQREQNEHSNLQNNRKEVRDVPVVARGARDRDAQLPALLRESRGWVRNVHGAQGAAKDACHDLSKVEFVGEVVKVVAVDGRNRIPHTYHNEYLALYHRYIFGY